MFSFVAASGVVRCETIRNRFAGAMNIGTQLTFPVAPRHGKKSAESWQELIEADSSAVCLAVWLAKVQVVNLLGRQPMRQALRLASLTTPDSCLGSLSLTVCLVMKR